MSRQAAADGSTLQEVPDSQPELPKTVSGKIRRSELRERLRAGG